MGTIRVKMRKRGPSSPMKTCKKKKVITFQRAKSAAIQVITGPKVFAANDSRKRSTKRKVSPLKMTPYHVTDGVALLMISRYHLADLLNKMQGQRKSLSRLR